MVTGVSKGFVKKPYLRRCWIPCCCRWQETDLLFRFCHPIDYFVHPEVKATVDGNTNLKLEATDKQLLGQVASEIRALRKPEPYKGKGIRYSDEVIRKKVGKAASK